MGLTALINKEVTTHVSSDSIQEQLSTQWAYMKDHVKTTIEDNNKWIRQDFQEVKRDLEEWKRLQPFFENLSADDAAHETASPTIWAALRAMKAKSASVLARVMMSESKITLHSKDILDLKLEAQNHAEGYTTRRVGDETLIALNKNSRNTNELLEMTHTSILTQEANQGAAQRLRAADQIRLNDLDNRLMAVEGPFFHLLQSGDGTFFPVWFYFSPRTKG